VTAIRIPEEAWRLAAARTGVVALVASTWLPIAEASDADWLRCRAMADDAQRLACYDREAAALSPAAPAAAFGLPRMAPAHEPAAIESTLSDAIEGWQAGSRIRLANGQVWQVSDDSTGFLRAGTRQVRIRRGALGAFYMEFEGTNRSPRVRRVE